MEKNLNEEDETASVPVRSIDRSRTIDRTRLCRSIEPSRRSIDESCFPENFVFNPSLIFGNEW